MRRTALCAALLSAAFFAVPAAQSLLPAASAQDKKDDKDKKDKEEEEKKKKEAAKKKREKALRDIGSMFGPLGVDWLIDRVPKGQKLTLQLGSDKDAEDYAVAQARGVLQKYFDGLQTVSVETTSKDAKLEENVGSFPMTYRNKTEKKSKSGRLYVTISGVDSTNNGLLTKLTVDTQ